LSWLNPPPFDTPIRYPRQIPKVVVPSFIGESGQVLNLLMHHGAGSIIRDYSGYENHGTIVGARWVDGSFGWALRFDGNDYVDCGDKESLTVGNQFTEAVWIYPTITDENYHGFLGYHPPEGFSYRAPSIWVYQLTKIHAGFGDGTSWNSFVTGDIITENAWNHVVVTFDGTYYKVYINGVEKYSNNEFAGKTPYPTPIRNIGRVGSYFNGIIALPRIYNQPLTPEEIRYHFESTRVLFGV